MSDLDRQVEALGSKVKARQQEVSDAFARHLPDFPLDALRETFGARIESLRSPSIDYGTEPEPGVVPADLWVIPKPPKGDYPAVVAIPMSKGKIRSLRRLRRVRSARKMPGHEHHKRPNHADP